jgi:hydroxypyruvate isomerase
MSPYEFDPAEIASRLAENRLELALFNLPAGDWAAGERGIAALPGREDEFQDGVGRALQLAKKFGTRRLNALAGLTPADCDDALVEATFESNLRAALPRCEAAGVRLLVEPINSRIDMPGFWLDSLDKAVDLIRRIGHPAIGLQFDVYHAAVMTGRPAEWLETLLPGVGHIQVADHPGRHAPGSGGIDFAAVFGLLDASSYDGWVGCEYRPEGATSDSLAWAARWLQQGRLASGPDCG